MAIFIIALIILFLILAMAGIVAAYRIGEKLGREKAALEHHLAEMERRLWELDNHGLTPTGRLPRAQEYKALDVLAIVDRAISELDVQQAALDSERAILERARKGTIELKDGGTKSGKSNL